MKNDTEYILKIENNNGTIKREEKRNWNESGKQEVEKQRKSEEIRKKTDNLKATKGKCKGKSSRKGKTLKMFYKWDSILYLFAKRRNITVKPKSAEGY